MYYVVLLTQIPPLSLSLSFFLSLSHTIRLYHPWLWPGLRGYIPCLYKKVVNKFSLVVLHLHVRVKGSTGEPRS